jgi:PrtD family type I secretion system ABC transporter
MMRPAMMRGQESAVSRAGFLSLEGMLGVTGTPESNPLRYALEASMRPLKSVALFSCLISLLLLVSPIYMMQVYDRVLASGSVETLVFLSLIAIFILGIVAWFEMVRGHMLVNLGEWIEAYLSRQLFERSLSAALAGSQPGDRLRDLAAVRNFLAGPAITAVLDAVWTPIFIIAAFLIHPLLGVLGLISAAILFALAWYDEVSTRAPLRNAGDAAQIAAAHAVAAVRNAELIESMGVGEAVAERWFEKNRAAMVFAREAGLRSKRIASASRFYRFAVYIVVLGTGAWLALNHQVTSGAIVGGSIIVARALSPIDQAIAVWRQLVSFRLALPRLNAQFAADFREETEVSLPPPAGRLTVEELYFTPPGCEKPVLRNVNFEVLPGDFVAVVGPSGSGKSTLMRLLVGLYPPSHGHVRLDAAEVWRWRRDEFGRHVGYLPQTVQLLPGTVRDNISRMNLDSAIDDQDVIAAAKWAGVHEMILRLPDGYDTLIGDRDAVLSGGQRQRIALALALFGAPRLLVLDEPDANLDMEGEVALKRALALLKEAGTTVAMVSHKLGLIDQCDKILVMKDGAGVMFGPRERVKSQLLQLSRPAPILTNAATEAAS